MKGGGKKNRGNVSNTNSPRRPRIHVSHRRADTHTPHHPSNIVDLLCEPVRIRLLAVQILTADADRRYPSAAVRQDRDQQRLLLSLEVCLVLRPDAGEEACVRRERGRHRSRQRVAVG